MPARSALAPGAVPFHLPGFASGRLAPDREILRMALALDRLDPALDIVAPGTGQPAIIRHGADVEIEAAVQFVAMLVGDAFGEGDHLFDMVGGDRPFRRLADIEPVDILPIGIGIIFGDIPRRLAGLRRCLFHLVIAGIGIGGQMADIGDIDDMGEPVALPAQRPAQQIGENIGAHIADMLIIIDGRAAGIDPRLARMDRDERLHLASQAVEQFQRVRGIVIHRSSPNGFPRNRSTDQLNERDHSAGSRCSCSSSVWHFSESSFAQSDPFIHRSSLPAPVTGSSIRGSCARSSFSLTSIG